MRRPSVALCYDFPACIEWFVEGKVWWSIMPCDNQFSSQFYWGIADKVHACTRTCLENILSIWHISECCSEYFSMYMYMVLVLYDTILKSVSFSHSDHKRLVCSISFISTFKVQCIICAFMRRIMSRAPFAYTLPAVQSELNILIHPITSTVQPLVFRSGKVIPSHTVICMW